MGVREQRAEEDIWVYEGGLNKGLEETTHCRASCSALLTVRCAGYQIKKNGIGGACGMHGLESRCIKGFGGET